MRHLFLSLFLCTAASSIYADTGNSEQQQAIEMKLQQLTQVDEQIENLVKKRVQLKAQAQQEMQAASEHPLPFGRRIERGSAEDTMQQVQALSEQIQQLESEREQILLSLE